MSRSDLNAVCRARTQETDEPGSDVCIVAALGSQVCAYKVRSRQPLIGSTLRHTPAAPLCRHRACGSGSPACCLSRARDGASSKASTTDRGKAFTPARTDCSFRWRRHVTRSCSRARRASSCRPLHRRGGRAKLSAQLSAGVKRLLNQPLSAATHPGAAHPVPSIHISQPASSHYMQSVP